MKSGPFKLQLLVMSCCLLPLIPTLASESFDSWIETERKLSEIYLLKNVSPPGARIGAIIASPSRFKPNYDYVWTRDAAIAVKSILELYQNSSNPERRARYRQIVKDFVDFSQFTQDQSIKFGIGLGEPKFFINGDVFQGPWGRPQIDGVATRALELLYYSDLLMKEEQSDYILTKLYDSNPRSHKVLKRDLEFLAAHGRESSFDVWEEVNGHHFYTLVLTRKALVEGGSLAHELGDDAAATRYLEQAKLVENDLSRFWSPELGIIRSTLDQRGDLPSKSSHLDSSVIAATLGGHLRQPLFPVNDERILATFAKLESTFQSLYPINHIQQNILGTAIGRYPEDHYDGVSTNSIGNPWNSLTLMFALFCHKLACLYLSQEMIPITAVNLEFFQRIPDAAPVLAGEVIGKLDTRFLKIIQSLQTKGDSYLKRVQYHANPDGSLSEQFNRVTGYQQGARDLSFNYSAFLLTYFARQSCPLQSRSNSNVPSVVE